MSDRTGKPRYRKVILDTAAKAAANILQRLRFRRRADDCPTLLGFSDKSGEEKIRFAAR
jgi:hypothetical protein